MRNKIIVAVSLIVVGGGCFYGGMKYDQHKNSASASLANFSGRGNFGNMTDEQRQQMAQRFGADGAAASGGQRVRATGGGIAGEIISKDEQSITIKLPDGGSKIIFYSDSTKITKFSDGSKDDLSVGASISANGSANSDGSISAQNVQVR